MKIPTEIRGVHYESMAAASRALGVSHGTIWSAAERGGLDRIGMQVRPINVRGVDYKSMSAAARALGVCYSTVRDAVVSGNQDNIGRRKYGL